ncbi:unnamed protein product, partial [marine sediment metagenome]
GAMPEAEGKALFEVGRIVQSEARMRAPQSPTVGQAKAAGISQRKRGREAGTLTRAIVMVQKRGEVIVGVLRGAALKYADYIHNGQGTRWQNIGPGSRAKQRAAKVGGKFLDRAYDDNVDELQKTYEAEIAKALP